MANKEEEKKVRATTVSEQLAQKPGEFVWDKQDQLDETTQKWLDRDPFEYDMGNDPLYQQYKEQYSALGKLAMQDTMGQATALTGGYANSYAQTVGQQAYQQYMKQLQSMMPELYSMSRSNYDAEGQQLYNEIALLEGQRSQAFNEYQADVSEWYNYLSYLQQEEANRLAAARASSGDGGNGSGSVLNGLPDEVKDRLGEMTDPEQIGVYLDGLAATGVIDPAIIPSVQAVYANGGVADGNTETNTGNTFVKANYMRTDEDGYYVFEKGGKEYKYEKGINPYTGTRNADTKNGTFSNGYQPNNVGGDKLKKTGDFVYVNGVKQNVWQTSDGTRYVWDGTENRYFKESEISYDY